MRKIIIMYLAFSSTIAFASGSMKTSAPNMYTLEQIKNGAIQFCDKMAIHYLNNFKDLSFSKINKLKHECYAFVHEAQKADDLEYLAQSEKKRWKAYYKNEKNDKPICSENIELPLKKLAPTQRQLEAEAQNSYFSEHQKLQLTKWAHSQPSFAHDVTVPLFCNKLGEVIFSSTNTTISGFDYINAEKVGFSFDKNNRFQAGEFVLIPIINKTLVLAMVLGRPLAVDPRSTPRKEILVRPEVLNQAGPYMVVIDLEYHTMIFQPSRIGKMTDQAKNWLVNKLSPQQSMQKQN